MIEGGGKTEVKEIDLDKLDMRRLFRSKQNRHRIKRSMLKEIVTSGQRT